MDEKTLISAYLEARKEKDKYKELLEEAQQRMDEAEHQLIELLEAKGASATSKYDGLGWMQIQKPRLYASCRIENQEQLLEFLKEQGREDLISTRVMPQTLSTYVAELIGSGTEVPDYISYYLKPNVRHYQ